MANKLQIFTAILSFVIVARATGISSTDAVAIASQGTSEVRNAEPAAVAIAQENGTRATVGPKLKDIIQTMAIPILRLIEAIPYRIVHFLFDRR